MHWTAYPIRRSAVLGYGFGHCECKGGEGFKRALLVGDGLCLSSPSIFCAQDKDLDQPRSARRPWPNPAETIPFLPAYKPCPI